MDMRNATRRIDADILIIGGGSAGCLAANRAKELDPSQKVVVFEKGDIKYSGSIARGMDALNIVAVPGVSTPELYVESSSMACGNILDEPPSYTMAQRSFALLKKLESWGVMFPKDKDGQYQMLQVHPKGKFLVSMKEPDLKVIVSGKALEKGTMVLNRTMGLDLLLEDGRVVGALGLNLRTGDLVVCRAKAVILANGGATRFGLPNSGYLYGTFDFPGNTGDGYCMGYRAGAQLTGFEYTMQAYLIKDINCPLLYITLTRGAKVVDGFGRTVDKAHINMSDLLKEYHQGRGPFSIRMTHLPEEKIEEIEDILFSTERPVQERFFQGRGIDFRQKDIELHPTEFYLCGGHGLTGLLVNERAETTVPGLYAAGDVSCVARGHLTGAFVFGEVAAECATEYLQGKPHVRSDEKILKDWFKENVEPVKRSEGRVGVREFEYKTRRLIDDYMTPPKNEFKLKQGLAWMERLRKELRELVSVKNSFELSKFFETKNIIDCGALSAKASLERKESRWGYFHYRTDYPETDDTMWLKHVVLSRGEAPDDIRVSHKHIDRMHPAGTD